MATKNKKSVVRRGARRRSAARVAAPPKLTRGHVTARDHKDLSTYELSCRVSGMMSQVQSNEAAIARLLSELAERRKAQRGLGEDVVALEGLIEGRR